MAHKVKTKRYVYGNSEKSKDIMLQVNGNTLQSIEREWDRCWKKNVYRSDTFCGMVYDSITEAKEHTMNLAKEGYFGETIRDWVTG